MQWLAWSWLSRLQVPTDRRLRVTPFEKSILGRKCDWLHCDLISAAHTPKQVLDKVGPAINIHLLYKEECKFYKPTEQSNSPMCEESGDGGHTTKRWI